MQKQFFKTFFTNFCTNLKLYLASDTFSGVCKQQLPIGLLLKNDL